jgi:hypothetical protein
MSFWMFIEAVILNELFRLDWASPTPYKQPLIGSYLIDCTVINSKVYSMIDAVARLNLHEQKVYLNELRPVLYVEFRSRRMQFKQ